MNVQYISDRAGHPTAVQIQMPIEEWDHFKEMYKEFGDQERSLDMDIPDWHLPLIEEELKKMENGTAGLVDWNDIKDTFKF